MFINISGRSIIMKGQLYQPRLGTIDKYEQYEDVIYIVDRATFFKWCDKRTDIAFLNDEHQLVKASEIGRGE